MAKTAEQIALELTNRAFKLLYIADLLDPAHARTVKVEKVKSAKPTTGVPR